MQRPRRPEPALLLAFAVLALSTACAETRPARGPDPRRRPPQDVVARYARPGPVPVARETVVARRPRFDTIDVVLPARFAADAPPPARESIRIRWWRPTPSDEPRPALLMSPILGGDGTLVADLALEFAREGWHVLLVRRGEIQIDDARPLAQIEDRLAADVSGEVQALDWLLTHADVDPARLATFGVSAGGIQGAMVAGADPRYVAHVIALAGGPLADVIAETEEKKLRRLVRRGTERTHATVDEVREALRRVIVTDPVLLGRYVPPEKVLLILARNDRSVPTWTGERLREALGEPKTLVLPGGHYGSILALPFVRAQAREFLLARIGGPPPL